MSKTTELQGDPLYIWFKQEFGDWRKYVKSKQGSFMNIMINSGSAEKYLEWVNIKYPEHYKGAKHAYDKKKMGQGFWDNSPFLPKECTGAFTGARMNAVHPVDDRVFTKRELMHFMGLPEDMKLMDDCDMGKVFQNVPSNTSADYVRQVVKFINGGLQLSDSTFIKQNNISKKIESKSGSMALFT